MMVEDSEKEPKVESDNTVGSSAVAPESGSASKKKASKKKASKKKVSKKKASKKKASKKKASKKKASKKKVSKKKASKKKASKKKASKKKAVRRKGGQDPVRRALAAVDELRAAILDIAEDDEEQRKAFASLQESAQDQAEKMKGFIKRFIG